MKRYPLKIISNCIIGYILFFQLLVSCSLTDRSANPYRSVKSLESALIDAVQIKNGNLRQTKEKRLYVAHNKSTMKKILKKDGRIAIVSPGIKTRNKKIINFDFIDLI